MVEQTMCRDRVAGEASQISRNAREESSLCPTKEKQRSANDCIKHKNGAMIFEPEQIEARW